MKKTLSVDQKKVLNINFSKLEKLEDLCDVLNEINKILNPANNVEINFNSLKDFTNPRNNKFREFKIKKKSGADRIIHAPTNDLKSILKSINNILQIVFEPHSNAYGFVHEKSIVDNAKKHLGKNYVYNIDLKDFFHSFDRNRVKMGIWYSLFNGDKAKEELCYLISGIVTHQLKVEDKIKMVLPQGSPVSPTLTNLLCYKLDIKLTGLAKRFKLSYSRYADDITFSSTKNVFKNQLFLNELNRIISSQGLEINNKKTRLQGNGYRKEVTGIIVNEKLNVHNTYVKKLRMWIYYIEKYGIDKATNIFLKDYLRDKGHVKKVTPSMQNVIEGKLLYLAMVKGKDDATFLKLKDRFYKTMGKVSKIDQILQVWDAEGINDAMKLYYKAPSFISLLDFFEGLDTLIKE